VSEGEWRSLNLGYTVGDDSDAVKENRRRLAEALGIGIDDFVLNKQVHGSAVRVFKRGLYNEVPTNIPPKEADGLVTDIPGLCLIVLVADCTPLLFCDPVKQVVAVAHAGWRGTMKEIGVETVHAMTDQFGCKVSDIRAGIGPSIGVCCYEVGDEVVEAAHQVFGVDVGRVLIQQKSGRYHLDLWQANRLLLIRAGLDNSQLEISGLCTSCRPEFYSHRRDQGRTGRFGAGIMLKDPRV